MNWGTAATHTLVVGGFVELLKESECGVEKNRGQVNSNRKHDILRDIN